MSERTVFTPELVRTSVGRAEQRVKEAKDLLKDVRDARPTAGTARHAAICVTELEGVQYRLKDVLGLVGSPRAENGGGA
ncbi:MAG: hypothetical protein H0W29_10270 [Gemmatimonadales bacterium]|nr:hypothetical protein [Gemmatimonadales bacterium]